MAFSVSYKYFKQNQKLVIKIKQLLVSLLTSPASYFLIRLIKGRKLTVNGCTYDIETLPANRYIKALIYLGLYEKSELLLINTKLPTDVPIIEFGASLGITTTQIASNTKQKVISFEVNPTLIAAIEANVKANGFENVEVNNVALGNGDSLYFEKGNDNTTGIISDIKSSSAIEVISYSLADIVSKYSLKEYFLVADIEGAEKYFLLEDTTGLQYCKGMIIEVHDLTFNGVAYSIPQLKSIIIGLGFKIVIEDGPVFLAMKH
jgi:FkbM family methyltransferase